MRGFALLAAFGIEIVMWVLLLEALVALSLLIFIVWWTTKPPKRDKPGPARGGDRPPPQG